MESSEKKENANRITESNKFNAENKAAKRSITSRKRSTSSSSSSNEDEEIGTIVISTD
jgi:hypothetical protein